MKELSVQNINLVKGKKGGIKALRILRQLFLSRIVVATCILHLFGSYTSAQETIHTIYTDNSPAQWGSSIKEMVVFGGDLYIGMGSDYAKIVHFDEGYKDWNDVTPMWDIDTAGDTMAMAVFNRRLYVGTEKGQIFRSIDGKNWTEVTGNYPESRITDMVVFNNYLYVCSQYISIYRSQDGQNWQPVVGPRPARAPYGFGNSLNHDLNKMEVFNGFLYAGVGRDNSNGIQIWRSADGTNWKLFQEVLPPPPPWSDIYPGHVHAMKAYNGYLYIGEYHGTGLFRTNGLTSSWEYIADVGTGDRVSMAVHDDKLFLGMSFRGGHYYDGDEYMIYSSINGIEWTPINLSKFYNSDLIAIDSMVSFKDKLYFGSFDKGGAQLFEYTSLPSKLWLEAECGDLDSPPTQVMNNKYASGGQYMYAPVGSGIYESAPGPLMASYEVNIAQADNYVLWGRVTAPSANYDSFWIQVDNGPNNLWDLEPGASWHWDAVKNRDIADPVIFSLTAGLHTIKVFVREDGTKIDKLLLTNDMGFVPSDMGNVAENCP